MSEARSVMRTTAKPSDDEWRGFPLGEVTENFDSMRIPVKGLDRKPGQYPYYGASGIIDHIDDYIFDGEYLLVAEDGENLRTRNTPIAFMTQGKFWANNHVHIIRGNHLADTRYLCYLLSVTDISGYLTGSTQPKLTQGNLNRIPVRLPRIETQRWVVSILDSLTDKIEVNRRMNRTLEAIARAIFKSWFIDFDPVHTKADGREPIGMSPETAAIFPDSFQDSPLGKIPKGWEVGCLGDIALHHRETMRPAAIESGMPYVALDDIPRGSISLSSWKNAEGLASSKSRFCEGDVLFGKLRPYFHKVVVAPTDGICSTDIVVIRAKQRQWAPLVLFLCSSKDFVAYNSAIMTGTKMPRTNWKDMSKYEITVPRSELASAFSRVVAPLVINTIRHTHECRRLAEVRDALLPRLVSGRSLKTAR